MTAPFEPPLQAASILCFLKDCLGGCCTNPRNTKSPHPQNVVERPQTTGGFDLNRIGARTSHQR
jgi:hypothetical protein